MKSVCSKCNGTGTEVVPGKGARACKCQRENVIDLQAYRSANAAVSGMDAILAKVKVLSRKQAEQEEAERVQLEVDGVLSFFEGHAPDFITDAVTDAIFEACAITGMEAPDFDDDLETRGTLKALFSKTKFLDLRRESA